MFIYHIKVLQQRYYLQQRRHNRWQKEGAWNILENVKEGVPKTLLAKIAGLNAKLAGAESDIKITNDINRDYTKEIEMLNHNIERRMAVEPSEAANLQTAIVKKELSDLEISMKEVKEKLAIESTKSKENEEGQV